MRYVHRLWEQIRGNLKYDILKAMAFAGVSWVLSVWHQMPEWVGVPAWVAPISVFLISLGLLIYVDSRRGPRTTLPRIEGTVSNFRRTGLLSETVYREHCAVSIDIHCELYVVNVCQGATNLRTVILDGSALIPPAEFSDIQLISPGEREILECGIGRRVGLNARMSFQDKQRGAIGRVNLDSLVARAIDAFGRDHRLAIDPGQSISTDPLGP